MQKSQVFKKIIKETQQTPDIRQKIIQKIEEKVKKTVLTFFTSFKFPVIIEDQDAVMIEEVLQNSEVSKNGLILILNSPGGSGLAAERIINICRAYSNNKFSVIVPNMAKSAATMICLGSDEIFMSKTSELGPIDPQIKIKQNDSEKILSVHSIIKSYEKLFKEAKDLTSGKIEPYLQQLSRYDAREIEELQLAMDLSTSIAVKNLKKGMMSSMSETDIQNKIKPLFLSPDEYKSHGRPVFIKEAKDCGLNITEIDLKSDLWRYVWELYLRTNYVLQRDMAKIVESKTDNFFA